MSKYINLNGNTWDGNSLSSKIKHDDKYGSFITLGWLVDAPSIDLEEHDNQIRAEAIEPIKKIIAESEQMMWCSDKTLKKIKEQLKEQKNE